MIDTKLIGVARTLKNVLNRKALGYEGSIDFAYGYITCRKDLGDITQKQANILLKCFASCDESYYFDFSSGKAMKEEID